MGTGRKGGGDEGRKHRMRKGVRESKGGGKGGEQGRPPLKLTFEHCVTTCHIYIIANNIP